MAKPVRFDRGSCSARICLSLLLAAIVASSLGCVTTTTNTNTSSSRVSQGLAKRDLGIDYLTSRRTGMAIRELRASMKLDSRDLATHLWLGEAYRRKGKTEEAEELLLSAIRLSGSPEWVDTQHAARLNLSAMLSQLGRYEESLEHCEALADDPTFSTPWRPLTNCGWALLQLGRLDEAVSHFKDALDFFPRFGPALLNLGILRTQEGKTLAAIKAFDAALDSGRLRYSALGEAHYRLGEIYVKVGRRDKAIAHFRQATEKAPYEDWGSQSQAYLDLLR